MRKSMLAALAALLLTAQPVGARAADEIHVFAWQVKRGNARPDILVGTMHVDTGPEKRLPAVLLSKLSSSTRFVMEADVENIPPEVISRYVVTRESLKKDLKPASWQRLVQAGAKLGMGPEQLDHLEAWYLGVALLEQAPSDAIMDVKLRREAREAGVAAAFLETPEDQFRALSSVSRREDVAQLEEMLDDPAKPKRELAELEEMYLKANLPGLQTMLFEPARVKAYPDFYKKIFWDRNNRWVSKLANTLATQDAFVAVGLGHLIGDRGLLKSMANLGYKVEPLPL
jgi:uncharacterized protein YbaP (TraB family)